MNKYLLILLSLLFGTSASVANELEIEADKMTVNDGTAEFSGKVNISNDSLVVTADRVQISEDNNNLTVYGLPASMSWTNNAIKYLITGPILKFNRETKSINLSEGGSIKTATTLFEGDSIILDTTANTLIAKNNVKLYLDCCQGSGSFVTYDANETVTLSGNPARLIATLPNRNNFEASGDSIQINKQTIQIRGSAQASYATETLHGELIIYNLIEDRFEAKAKAGERVKAVIHNQ